MGLYKKIHALNDISHHREVNFAKMPSRVAIAAIVKQA